MSQKTKKKSRTSFGATAPPFLDYLKDILNRYPDGGQILKELIQNADDANATEVVFIHDDRSYGTESLWTPELGQYQGPALYVYNNATFTEEDWEGIQLAGRSYKRDDPSKVGRFGIGFNSVYHITDLPCILSGRHLGFMDPQEQIFGEREGGFRWFMDDPDHQEALTAMRDQFQPLRDIVSLISGETWPSIVTEHQYFNGTMFRFPLRNTSSNISDNLYNSEKVVDLFESFIAEAELSLLFLKNVTSVSLKHVDADGRVNTRLRVKSSAQGHAILGSKSDLESSTRFKLITQNSDDPKKWLLATCTMKKGSAGNLDHLAEKLSFSPQVELAFPCGEKRDSRQSRLICFLPLPNNESNKTGLPVYVNACFGLTDNRRHIKWQEPDQKHDEHAMWNELLLKEVLPQTYLVLIKDAIKLAQESLLPASRVYDLWPDIAQMKHKDKWRAVALDVLKLLFRENTAVLSLAKDETKFVPPSEALLPCNGPTSPCVLDALERTLVSCGENLVTSPQSISRAIAEAHPNPGELRRVTPAFVRRALRGIGVQTLSKDDKLRLLEYAVSDGNYKELEGLQLLPLSDSSFRAFTRQEVDTALIDSSEFPRTLLPCCKNLFIPHDISPDCRRHLREMAGRSLFRITNVTAHLVAVYAQRFLPEGWKKTGSVTWDISASDQPPLNWLQDFWKFLDTHFNKLSNFIGMPLIPVSPVSANQPVTLSRLQKNPTLIFDRSKQSELPKGVAKLVNTVGGTVVKVNEWLRHKDLDSYVLCPSPKSVLKVLMNLNYEDMMRGLTTASRGAREELKEYLSRLESVSWDEINFLLKLPLFQTMKGVHVPAQSKEALLLISDLKVPTEFPLPDSVVQCATEVDRRLLLLLKVKLLNTAEAAGHLVDCIEKQAFRVEDTERVMAWVLQHGGVLFFQNQRLKDKCKKLRFIQVNGEAKETSSFFDPTNATFKAIFESEFFPPPFYTETPQMLKSLTDLGLINREGDVTPPHLLHAATLIDQSVAGSPDEAMRRATAFLNMLDTCDLLSKFSESQLNSLKMTKWIQCPEFSGSGSSQKSPFFCPDDIRHSMYKDIVGHVMPLLGLFSDRFSTKLGLKRPPPPEKVIENLSVLMSEAEMMADPDKNVDFKRQLRCIYEHMQSHESDFVRIMNKDQRWVWSHGQFVSPRDLVLEYPRNLDLSSYIGRVPEEFLSCKELLQGFGLRTTLSDEEIVGILKSLQQTVEERRPPFANSSEIKVSIEILNWLWREKKTVKEDIPVPVHAEGGQCTFKPSSAVVFCDVSKNGLSELKYGQEEIDIIHEEIPKAAAEWLNVGFLSTHILDPELVGIEQCGQSEPITTRIKNILKEYDEESDIFKELIQNAEDAGAEQCEFLMDFRVHKYGPEELIDPAMSQCQGPCLWAFNNETFKADDWENIVRVGSASKENKVEKIGKFGLGFNTVYHVTDIPSILSGTSLLILDPNVTHLKKHIKHKSNPGLRLNLSQQRLFKWFPGQFGPYNRIFDCDITQQKPYAGTLIRLPFRTEEEAITSEISKRVYCKSDIISLQECLSENSKNHLLFLKNICALALQSIPKGASTPPRDDEIETILKVSKTIVATVMIRDEAHVSKQQHSQELLMKLDVKGTGVIDYRKADVVKMTSQSSSVPEVQSWLLYSCFGTQQSMEMSRRESQQAKFSLPVGGVAVPLQIDAKTAKLTIMETDFSGKAFCFLPLSILTGLPVNINGTFAVTSNRKGLWESGVKGDWNKALLQDPIVTAYVTALLVLKEMAKTKQLEPYSYHTFWPHREKVSEHFKCLVDAFYSRICQPSLELFCDGELWCSMSSAIFLHESIEENKDIGALAVQVCKKHVKPPNHVVPLPQHLRNSFKQAGLENVLKERTWNWEKFYQQAVFNNLGSIDPKTRDTLVLHAIDLNIQGINALLLSYPCIPTKAGQLQYIRKLVNPSGKVACLFELEEERLLGGTSSDFCSLTRSQRLLALGMASEDLAVEDIAERTAAINGIWSTDRPKAYRLLRSLLDLMKKHSNDVPCGEDSSHWQTIKMTKFLPAFCPGDTSSVTLERPMDIFNDKCSLLVNMTQHVLDHSNLKVHNTDPVLKFLGVNDEPSLEIILRQLQESHKRSQSTNKAVLQKIAYECYSFLNQCLPDPKTSASIHQAANSFPFILVNSTFEHINCVAENEQFDAKPYLHVLPYTFSHFKSLWECVGVERSFTVQQLHSVLQELRSRHGDQPMPQGDLSICLTILNKGIYEAKRETVGDCLVPNEDGVLQHARELIYNDSPWMSVPSGVTLCHRNIARTAALHFGIKTTRHATLLNHEVQNPSPFSFPFEQQEKITVRIKNIISAYPSNRDILKELIQNADDAEATEIHFVWDKRQHNVGKTFGENWNQLQGPALCVYNNKVFSDADLEGIKKLGEGGKHNTPGKIGKYGIGFNSVYHLTDCPSILTGDKLLCISDPNQKYIESHSDKPQAGIGYTLDDTFKNMYADVYNSYLPGRFPLGEGTMFRLPLRTGPMATNSKISNKEVTDTDMRNLCSALSAYPDELILFLKNICKIQVHEISNRHPEEIKTIFAVEKQVPGTSREKKGAFVKLRQDVLNSHTPVMPQKVIYEARVLTSDKKETRWIIAEQFGSFKNTSERTPDQLPQAAVAARTSINFQQKSLFLPSIFKFTGGAFCSLPLPGETGLPVHINANFEVDSARRSLWKEDGKSVKYDWNEFLKETVIAVLYADLLHYISSDIANKKVPLPHQSYLKSSYLYFWPIVSKDVGQEWHNMIQEVYKSIQERDLEVIPLLRSSTFVLSDQVFKEEYFEWCSINETELTKAPHLAHPVKTELNPILEDLGMPLVPFSLEMQDIWKNFKSAGVEVQKVTPTTVQNFLRETRLNDPAQTDEDLPLPITDTLIRDESRCSTLLNFCLQEFKKEMLTDDNSNNSSSFNGIPLLLTRDNILRVFDSDSHKVISPFEDLFLIHQCQFADFRTNWSHIQVLQKFNLIKTLTVPEAKTYLQPEIQSLLQDCELDPDGSSGLWVPNEKTLKWLRCLWNFLTSEMKPKTSGDEKESLTMSDVRTLFSDFCILPVVCPRLHNKQLLTTMGMMSKVMPLSSLSGMTDILCKLGFMKLDHSGVDKDVPSFLESELMNLNDKGAVLDQLCNIDSSEFSRLSDEDLSELQCFLQGVSKECKDKLDYQSKLKSLPIFLTVDGKRERIDGQQGVFVLNEVYLGQFPQLFSLGEGKSIFLKNTQENHNLATTLKLQVLSDLEYFMKFILPHVHRLAEPQLLQCLTLILSLQQGLDYSSHEEAIISSLKTLRLIRNSQGNLEMASYYFDEGVELYTTMLPQEKFIPKSFWTQLCHGTKKLTENLKELLRKLGMRHIVSRDDIIQFARQLEAEARGDFQFEKLKQKSSLLLKTALDFVSGKADKVLLKSIADIKFIIPVPVQKELSDYHQSFAAKSTTVAVRGSLIDMDANHQELIWSSMTIIHVPVYMSKELKAMMVSAGAFEQPPSDCVTRNLHNICRAPCTNDALIETRARVFRSCYTYLHQNGFDAASLADLPIVLVEKDKDLAKAKDVCISLHCPKEFRPYLYTVSRQDARFEDFFKKIGVNYNATAEQYCKVLAAIHDDSEDKVQLNPNQKTTVKRAVEHLFKLIKKDQNPHHFRNTEALYIPATDGKLHPSCTLYYNNTVFEIKRLEEGLKDKLLLLERLSDCHLGNDIYEHHQLLRLLPQRLQPKMLFSLTEEKLLSCDMQLCELKSECQFSGWFQNHLSSLPFRHGLICLIREEAAGKVTQEDAADMCMKTFGSIQIVCCTKLETALYLENELLSGTTSESDVFVKREQGGSIFYMRHNDDMPPKVINDVNMTLTTEINNILGNKIAPRHFLVLGQLLMCDTLDDVKKALAKNGIHDSAEAENQLFSKPAPGADIPAEWYDSLDMNLLNNFEEGEYVGYSTDNKYIYAVIVEEVSGNSGQYSQRYKIKIGQEEPIEVSCVDLYQIKRPKKGAGRRLGPSTELRHMALVAGAVSHSEPSTRSLPASLEEAKREIDKSLKEIWPLPQEERNKALKRLYLRWHPDKNLDCYDLATEAFKYLQNRIDELLSGRARNAGSANQGRNQDFRHFYSSWNQEARYHRQGRERFFNARRSYNFWAYNQNVPRPDREEAQRWCRQARCDLEAAHRDVNGRSTEWCLFKVHQAVEKLLIAAAYKKHGQHPDNSSITAMAAQVSLYSVQLRDVPQIVETLKKLGVDAKKTQYPNLHPFPNIPNDQFPSENGELALDKASKLLRKIESYVN